MTSASFFLKDSSTSAMNLSVSLLDWHLRRGARSSSGRLSSLMHFSTAAVRVATDVAHGDARLLGVGLALLNQLAATFLGERRERQADDRAVVGGGHAQIALEDRLLDGLETSSCPTAR